MLHCVFKPVKCGVVSKIHAITSKLPELDIRVGALIFEVELKGPSYLR